MGEGTLLERPCRSSSTSDTSGGCRRRFRTRSWIVGALPRTTPSSAVTGSSSPRTASATWWSASSRRVATTSIRRRPTTTRISSRRTPISPSTSGCAKSFGADALVHMGKHGNLEWLPGKALALSEECFPEVALGPLPVIYPFIVNDPGEGAQAKRRSAAVVVDHLMPADGARRELRAGGRDRGAHRRICRGAGGRSAPRKSGGRADRRACRRHTVSTAISGSTWSATATAPWQNSTSTSATSRSCRSATACTFWARGRSAAPAPRRWWRSPACRAGQGGEGTPRCSARSPRILGSASTRWIAVSLKVGTGRGRRVAGAFPSPLAGEGQGRGESRSLHRSLAYMRRHGRTPGGAGARLGFGAAVRMAIRCGRLGTFPPP